MKTRLLYFILGAIIFSGITAVAVGISANNITYTKQDGTETNVSSALTELYDKASSKPLYSLGTISGYTSPNTTKDFDISFYQGYSSLTINSFVLVGTDYKTDRAVAGRTGTCYEYNNEPSIVSYNQETGILTVNDGTFGYACTSQGVNTHYPQNVIVYIK